jgi:hypothetical protein
MILPILVTPLSSGFCHIRYRVIILHAGTKDKPFFSKKESNFGVFHVKQKSPPKQIELLWRTEETKRGSEETPVENRGEKWKIPHDD